MDFEPTPSDPSLRDPLPDSPLGLLARWLDEAAERAGGRNPDAMALATVDAAGDPGVRMVLWRHFDPRAGRLSFYTNRDSPKGRDLAMHPRAAGVLYWDALGRQVRVSGPVAPVPEPASDAYWASRHPLSRIAAYASRQSRPIASRAALIERLEAVRQRFGDGARVPRPPQWGGYALTFERVELWVASEGRAHDRARWTRDLAPDPEAAWVAASPWRVERLQP